MNIKAVAVFVAVAGFGLAILGLGDKAALIVREYMGGKKALVEVAARAEIETARAKADSAEKIALINAAGGGWTALYIVLVGGFGLTGLGMVLGFLAWRERAAMAIPTGIPGGKIEAAVKPVAKEIEYPESGADMFYAGYVGEVSHV